MSVKPFDKLTAAGKRLRIARDVLKQLDARNIVAVVGTYILPNTGVYAEPVKQAKDCKACALGSLVFCALKYDGDTAFSKFTDDQSNLRRPLTDELGQFFTRSQLDMIECAFEGRAFNSMDDVEGASYEELAKARENYWAGVDAHSGPEGRLRDIMHNIIANKGTYVPTGKLTPAPVKARNQYSPKKDV